MCNCGEGVNMTIEEIKSQIRIIENNAAMPIEEKRARISVLQTCIQKSNLDEVYDKKLNEFIEISKDLNTNGSYPLSNSIEENKKDLENLIVHSDLGDMINTFDPTIQDLENYSLALLKSYSFELNNRTGIDVTVIDKLIEQYEVVLEIQKIEQRENDIIERNLSSLIGKELMSKYNEHGVIAPDGKTAINLNTKTPEELELSHKEALLKAEELYVNEGILDKVTYRLTATLINQVFEYHKNGNRKIPSEMIEFTNNKNK